VNAEDLKRQFQSTTGGASTGHSCPTPETIWDTIRLDDRHPEFGVLLDHVAACPACAIAWRLARDFGAAENPAATRQADRLVRRGWVVPAAAAAAALLVLVLSVQFLGHRPPVTPAFRAPEDTPIRSLIPEQTVLSRSAFLLRWSSAGSEETRYTVRVLDEDLKLLDTARSLEHAEYLAPEPTLARLAPGAVVLWQVDAIYPDGRRLTSATFLIRVE
jgi:hypothetical protein